MKWFNFFLTFSHKPFDFEWLHNLKRKRHFFLCQALFTHANMNELLNKNFKRMEAWYAAMQFWSRESTSKWFTPRHLGTKCEVGWVVEDERTGDISWYLEWLECATWGHFFQEVITLTGVPLAMLTKFRCMDFLKKHFHCNIQIMSNCIESQLK